MKISLRQLDSAIKSPSYRILTDFIKVFCKMKVCDKKPYSLGNINKISNTGINSVNKAKLAIKYGDVVIGRK